MDEERAQIEEVLQRGEQILHQPMEDNKKEKIRLQLLLLHTRYNKTKVLSWEESLSTQLFRRSMLYSRHFKTNQLEYYLLFSSVYS